MMGTKDEIEARYGRDVPDPILSSSEDEYSSSSSDDEYTPVQSPAPDPIDEHGEGSWPTNDVATGACSPSLPLSFSLFFSLFPVICDL